MPPLTAFPFSLFLLAVVFLCLFVSPATASITSQFQHFYPQHGEKYAYILATNCSTQFSNYLTGRPQDFPLDWLGGGGKASRLTQPVITCILENTSEYIKAASSSAQVLLGVTPTLLALLGASTDELAMLTVVGRRPLLALFLAIGSPSVYVARAFEHSEPLKLLQDRKRRYHNRWGADEEDVDTLAFSGGSKDKRGRHGSYRSATIKKYGISITQYLIALAAAANIATQCWELGTRTVCSFWSETIYGPLVWATLSIPIYGAGALALWMQVRRTDPGYFSPAVRPGDDDRAHHANGQHEISREAEKRKDGVRACLGMLVRTELSPCTSGGPVSIEPLDERKRFLTWSWVLSTCTIFHILFGTLLLSSLLFIGPQDALVVIVRYMMSVLVCRVVLMFELAGLRERYRPSPGDDNLAGSDAMSVSDGERIARGMLIGTASTAR
ncbi:hypothetical protein F4775DRAFT_534321 [Biscogniauxia sp. FL1348]|nr:hypothetical protein F4775DRAFT_534321 [Biscogniauxia sp. FL1348]